MEVDTKKLPRAHRVGLGRVAAMAVAAIGFPLAAIAEEHEAHTADKSGYSIFSPTPVQLMRPMSADRPDFTESPYTVDAGHVQLEMSFVDYAFDNDNGRVHSLAFAPVNLKFGLTNGTDVQFVFDPYIHEHTEGGGTANGNGDFQVRLKMNLWGNDGGQTAFGIMPFVKIPVASDDLGNQHVDGGVIFSLGVELPHDWGLGVMLEVDAPFDESDNAYDVEFIHTAVVGHDLFGDLAGYCEYIGISSSDGDTHYQALIGAGVTYGLSENAALDTGVNVGLTEAADDVNVFSGITLRY